MKKNKKTSKLVKIQNFGFVGLSLLGWICFGLLWAAQAALFWKGMDAIRRFIDWAGPAVYLVMLALAVFLVAKAGIGNLSFNFKGENLKKIYFKFIFRPKTIGISRIVADHALRNCFGGFLLLRANAEFWRFFTLRKDVVQRENWQFMG